LNNRVRDCNAVLLLLKLFSSTNFLAVVACLLWSSAFAVIKAGLQYTTPLQFAGLRFMLAGLMILPFCGNFSIYLRNVFDHRRTVLLVAFFQTTLLYILFYPGLNMLPGAIGAIITGSQPLIIAVAAHFVARSERMTVRRMFSILFGIAGVVIISLNRGEMTLSAGSQFLGLVLLLFANISSGIGDIVVSRHRARIPPLTLTSSQLFLGGLVLFLISIPVEEGQGRSYPALYFGSLLWLSFLSAASYSIWFTLLKREGVAVSDLNIWKFLIPVSGACLSWALIPGESPELSAVAGMFCIALALLILNVTKKTYYFIHR
jgi:drug/metabolite transporter (DMT)-like permease